jgi:NADPH2:quinone reductase
MAMNPSRTHPLIDNLLARVARKELTVVIDATFPLAQAAQAHRHIESRKAFGRVIMTP